MQKDEHKRMELMQKTQNHLLMIYRTHKQVDAAFELALCGRLAANINQNRRREAGARDFFADLRGSCLIPVASNEPAKAVVVQTLGESKGKTGLRSLLNRQPWLGCSDHAPHKVCH